jgi:pimeloyl-ACP methyl ester carboxylesterase
VSAFWYRGGLPPGPGEPVLLVHGAGMDHNAWRYLARFLAGRGWSVLAPDLPGHGLSEGPLLSSVEKMAEWLDRESALLDDRPLTVVGHSLGGLAGLHLAAERPRRVSRLILVAVAADTPVNPDLLAAAAAGEQKAVDLILSWSYGAHGRRGSHPEAGAWNMAATGRILERGLGRSLAGDLEAWNAYRGSEAAARVEAPTLVIAGGEDRMTPPRRVAELAAAIPGSRLQIVEEGGHMLPLERPVEIRRAIVGFLATP